jgi:hypothetical protein
MWWERHLNVATILPNKIPAPGTAVLNQGGAFQELWWLFFYNIAEQVLGTQGNAAAAYAAQLIADLDADADTSDLLSLVQRVANIEKAYEPPDFWQAAPTIVPEPPPDPAPRAPPVQAIAVGASPYTYQSLFDGAVIVSGGTVSAMAISRDNTTFYTVTNNMIPVSRLDYVKITYSAAPTAVLLPR